MLSTLVFIGALLLIFVFSGLAKGRSHQTDDSQYRKKRQLLTNAEQAYFSVLEQVVAGRFRIYVQVRIADVLKPQINAGPKFFAAFNPIAQKHFDFVLCDPATFEVLVAIELNDASHERADRKQRDHLVEAACRSAGLPLIMQRASFSYDQRNIESSIINALGPLHEENIFAETANRRDASWTESSTSAGSIVAVIVAIVLLLAGWYYLIKPESVSVPVGAPVVTNALPKKSQQNVIDQQQVAKQAVERTKLEAALQEAERIKLQQAKEQSWHRYFQPSKECQTTEDWDKSVSCGNQHIRAKQEFEAQWNAAH